MVIKYLKGPFHLLLVRSWEHSTVKYPEQLQTLCIIIKFFPCVCVLLGEATQIYLGPEQDFTK